ncbi:centromere B dimerization protein [Rutstroemia sp. NJR-2017a WRK4]|nr:centromere B dimerization protein [Rutstroemia sp. NJR-2017a WRK4]
MASAGPSGANSSRSTPGGHSSTSSPVSRSRAGMPTPRFTRIQQDQQARNKEPNADTFDDDSSDDGGRFGEYDLYGNESYTTLVTRREAVYVLDNPELLMMHAQARNDSIPATRHYFRKLLSGRPPTQEEEEASKAARVRYFKKMSDDRAKAASASARRKPVSSVKDRLESRDEGPSPKSPGRREGSGRGR